MAGSRLDKLRARRLDPLTKVAGMREAYARIVGEDDAVKYAIGAMQPIDPAYNSRTVEERSRVESQLSSGFWSAGLGVEFDYQGSVTNDTNIKAFSDVDLLTIESRWTVIQYPNVPPSPYTGDPIKDLRQIRRRLNHTRRN